MTVGCGCAFSNPNPTPTRSQVELVAVLKRLAVPLDQVMAQTTGRAPSIPAHPPVSFFPPSPEALLLMTGMKKESPPLPPPPPPLLQSPAPPAAPAAVESSAGGGRNEPIECKLVLVALSRNRGGEGSGARLFYPSKLEKEDQLREEASRLIRTHLLPLVGEEEEEGELVVECKLAPSYCRTVLRLTKNMRTVVLENERGGDGLIEAVVAEGGRETLQERFDVLVKGVM